MSQKILFLDIETTGLNPSTDTIIELAGVACSFEDNQILCLSEFSSLINPNIQLDEAVTRITGIKNQDLASAPSLNSAKEMWTQWLSNTFDPGEKVIVIGHSLIEFDLKFINNLGFVLPQDRAFNDTLYLAKILLPQIRAVNLEFLVKQLELEPAIQKLLNPQSQILSEAEIKSQEQNNSQVLIADQPIRNISAHRALYDAFCCVALLEKLLIFIKLYNLDSRIIQLIQDNYLFLDLNSLILSSFAKDVNQSLVFQSSQSQIPSLENIDSQIAKLNWNGDLVDSGINSLINKAQHRNLDQWLALLHKGVPDSWLLVIIQLMIIRSIKEKFDWNLQFHGRFEDSAIARMLIDFEDSSLQTSNFKNDNTTYQLPIFEQIIWQVDEVASTQYRIDQIIELTDWILQIISLDKRQYFWSELSEKLQNVNSSYEFFMLCMQAFWIKGRFEYRPATMPLDQKIIAEKLDIFIQNLQNLSGILKNYTLNFQDSQLLKFLVSKLEFNLSKIVDFDKNLNCTLIVVRNNLRISVKQKGFNLVEHLGQLFAKYKDSKLLLPTFLSEELLTELIKSLGLVTLKEEIFETVDFAGLTSVELDNSNLDFVRLSNEVNKVELDEEIESSFESINQNQKLSLVLCGTNRTLTKLEDKLRKEEDKRWIMFGLSGSLTKIISKILGGFVGVVGMKQSDVWAINLISKKVSVGSVIMYGDYGFIVSSYFANLDYYYAKKFINSSIDEQIKVAILG